MCTAEAYGRQVHVALAEPLGDRRLVEAASGRVLPVFDGSSLRAPMWLPAGWELLSEGPGYPDPTSGRYWSQSWGEAQPAPVGDRCVPTSMPVTLVTGPVDLIERHPAAGLAAGTGPGTALEVGGHPAVLHVDETTGSAAEGSAVLVWSDGSTGHVLQTGPRCVGDETLPLDVLVRIAESVETVESVETAD
jgi:hypothetical protein